MIVKFVDGSQRNTLILEKEDDAIEQLPLIGDLVTVPLPRGNEFKGRVADRQFDYVRNLVGIQLMPLQ